MKAKDPETVQSPAPPRTPPSAPPLAGGAYRDGVRVEHLDEE